MNARRAVPAVVALVVCAVAGCVSGPSTSDVDSVSDPAAVPTSPPTTSVPTTTTDVSRLLAAAIDSLFRSGSGHFRQVVTVGTSPSETTSTGRYAISSSSAETVTTDARTGAVATVRLVDGMRYLNLSSWPTPVRRCWKVSASTQQRRAPVAGLEVLVRATGESVDAGRTRVRGRVVGNVAAALLAPDLMSKVPDPSKVWGELPAVFTLRNGLVASYSVTGRGLADSLRAAGVKVTNQRATQLARTTATVVFQRLGRPVEVQAPPMQLRMKGDGSCLG